MKRLAVGILAHVDAGKTTLSEAMLYAGGMIRHLGRVDKGDAFLDTYELEKKRGITIFSKQARLAWDDICLFYPSHLSDLKPSTGMSGTIDLTKGILKGFEERGYKVGGFDAYITRNVISAAGVSSSASYEMLICSMLNTMFNIEQISIS